MTKQEASTRWWYRLIKVIFIASVLFSLISPVVIFVQLKPVLDQYQSRFSLKCTDGRIRGDFDGSDLKYDLKSFASSYGLNEKFADLDKLAKMACFYKEAGEELDKIIKSVLEITFWIAF